MGDTQSLTVIAGGDVGPMIQPVTRLAELIEPTLATADFRIAQCERTYSRAKDFPRWDTVPSGEWSRLDPEYAEVYRAAGIDVVSLASNHALDWGYPPLFDTLDLFADWGIQTMGAGRDEAEARKPVILEKNGVKVAVLAYASVVRDGWAASGEVPGLATIRATTTYQPIDFQPGTPTKVLSTPNARDVEAAQADIAAIKDEVDAVMIFLHWGIPYLPKLIADYQPPVAHALIDAGADIIVGHHAHSLRAVEEYNGGICLYSIGNFMTTGNVMYKQMPAHARWGLYWYDPPGEDSLYMFPNHCRKAVLPRLTFGKGGLERASLLPVLINDLAQPEPLSGDDERFTDVLEYLEWVSDQFPHTFVRENDEIVLR